MSTKSKPRKFDVTVIGAGIVGVCCTLSLLEKGKTVRLIDRSGVAEKTSYGNAGVISPWSCIPQSVPGVWKNAIKWMIDPLGPVRIRPGYLPTFLPWGLQFLRNCRIDRVEAISRAMATLMRGNIELYRHHLSGTGEQALLRDTLMLMAYRDPSQIDMNDIGIRLRTEKGGIAEQIDGAELARLEPALSSDFKGAIVIHGQGRTLSPGKLAHTLAEKACSNGAELTITDVVKICPGENGEWNIHTPDELIDAGALVIAAGPWSTRLLEPLGLKLPMAFERGYHLEFENPGVSLENSILDVDYKFITSSMLGGVRSAGTAEFDRLDAAPNYQRAQMLESLTRAMLPDLNTNASSQWMGIRPSFSDSLPCIDRARGHNSLFLAFGHSHYGLGMAPQTGEMIADLISGNDSGVDMSPYSMGRFF